MITGKDIISLGYKPGRWFTDAIATVNRENLVGESLISYLDSIIPPPPKPTIPLKDNPESFHLNIRAEHEDEISNVLAVTDTMVEIMKVPTVINGAVMPDACPTGSVGNIPVGGVVVTENAIHPSMHSADICCSVMATDLGFIDPKKVMDIAITTTHFGYGGRNEFSDIPKEFIDRMKGNPYLKDEKSLLLASQHMGTQGDGNHFLFVGVSEKTGRTMIVSHHGSRGLGAYLYKKGMVTAEKFRKELSPATPSMNAWIPYTEKEGVDYWEALQFVRDWTKMNHNVLHQAIERDLNCDFHNRFWNEHNFVFKEGSKFYHAKGATPLTDNFVPDSYDGLRLIPLNMSEPILIVKGNRTDNNLGFAPHGAGRNISRSKHIVRNGDRTIEEIFHSETNGLDVRFFSGNIDISELPSAYKNADNVVAQMKEFGLGEVVDRIIPYGSIMAGNFKMDAPWKKKKK